MATAQRNTNYNQKLFSLIFLPYQAFEEVETDLSLQNTFFFFLSSLSVGHCSLQK